MKLKLKILSLISILIRRAERAVRAVAWSITRREADVLPGRAVRTLMRINEVLFEWGYGIEEYVRVRTDNPYYQTREKGSVLMVIVWFAVIAGGVLLVQYGVIGPDPSGATQKGLFYSLMLLCPDSFRLEQVRKFSLEFGDNVRTVLQEYFRTREWHKSFVLPSIAVTAEQGYYLGTFPNGEQAWFVLEEKGYVVGVWSEDPKEMSYNTTQYFLTRSEADNFAREERVHLKNAKITIEETDESIYYCECDHCNENYNLELKLNIDVMKHPDVFDGYPRILSKDCAERLWEQLEQSRTDA